MAPFLGAMGLAAAIGLTCSGTPFIHPSLGIGAGYGTAKAGVGIMSMGVMRPELVMRALLPVVMAGIIGIYGLIVDMVLLGSCKITASITSLLSF